MGLLDFFNKPKNKKVDIDGKEVVDFTDLTVPVPVVHSNTIDEGHDVFDKAKAEEEPVTIEPLQETIIDLPTIKDDTPDLSSINMHSDEPSVPAPEKVEEEPPTEAPEITEEDMAIFKSCLLAEVKRKKSTGSLATEEDVHDFCHERMSAFKEGKFDYPADIKKSMKKMLDAKNMIQDMMPKKEDSGVVKKAA